MAKEKKEVTVLQTVEGTDGGLKQVREFTPEHATELLAYEKSKGISFWEKAPDTAKVTHKLEQVGDTSFVGQAAATAEVEATLPVESKTEGQ